MAPIPIPTGVRLTPMMVAVLRLRCEGKTQAEIAEMFGLKRAAVTRRELRLRRRFIEAGHMPPQPPDRFRLRVSVSSLN